MTTIPKPLGLRTCGCTIRSIKTQGEFRKNLLKFCALLRMIPKLSLDLLFTCPAGACVPAAPKGWAGVPAAIEAAAEGRQRNPRWPRLNRLEWKSYVP